MPEGTVLRDRYRLEQLIGRGGMADVYLAFDARRQVRVAVKLLHDDLAGDLEFLDRFQSEARALSRLDHPYIVRFYSFERQRPAAFIVMDYVPGSSLRARLTEAGGPLPLPEVTGIVRQVGAALQYAHNEGFVHRDIKPGNILLRPDGTALLSDFGIAQAVAAMTMKQVTLGTPAYMSPEQILGQEADGRTDVYGFGVVLYEMVTGRRPFIGDGDGGSSAERLRQAHLHQAPSDPRVYSPDLPPAAAAAIMRALAKNPAQRWPDMTAFVRAWEMAVGFRASDAPSVTTPAVPVATDPPQSEAGAGTQPLSPAGGKPRRAWLPWALAAIFTAMLLLVVALGYRALAAPNGSSAADAEQTLSAVARETAIVLAQEWVTATAGAIALAIPESTATLPPTPTNTTAAAATATVQATATVDAAATVAVVQSQTRVALTAARSTADAKARATGTARAGTAAATRDSVTATAPPTAAATAAVAAATAPPAATAPTTTATAAADLQVTATAEATPLEPAGVLVGFESDVVWLRGDEASGELVRSQAQVYDGAFSGQLTYDLPAVSNNYVVFRLKPALYANGEPSGISAWVYGDGSAHYLNAWVCDILGERRQYTFGRITHTGWAQMKAPFDDLVGWPNGHIDGPDNGVLDYPVGLCAVVLDGVPDNVAAKGTIYLDDIAAY